MSRCESHDFAGLPDEYARLRIIEGLEENFLVEAGAGSGKTTAMVQRMVALVRTGACEVRHIAAVTFTRKAAAELRQRFQVALECALIETPEDDPSWERVSEAVAHIDEAFLGTIHAFCAKLLRERPLEAGLDPGFREVLEAEAFRMQQAFWIEFLERLAADGDPDLGELADLGIEARELEGVYGRMVENPDVDFLTEEAPPPDPETLLRMRAELEELLDRALEMMPAEEPDGGWDKLAGKIRRWAYLRRARDWSRREPFLETLAELRDLRTPLTQKKWADTGSGKTAAKKLQEDFHAFGALAGEAARLVESWWAYRYPVVIRLARRAAAAFSEQRRDEGTLNFQDLLVLTAELLRSDPVARQDLGERYQRLLVDEFQDTDPLQAEIILLLASNPGSSGGRGARTRSRSGESEEDPGAPAGRGLHVAAGVGEDWRDVIPRPGSLFVVGDPKQSIYRFRRADIALYEFVKERFAAFGECLRLDANFRSLPRFGDLVSGVFQREEGFPEVGTGGQAGFAPLLTRRDDGPGLIQTYTVAGDSQGEIATDDAARIATCIAQRVRELGDRKPGDFMILTGKRKYLSVYARALEDHGLPVEVSGAGVGFEDELRALLLLLRTLADPENAVRVLGTVTGPLFGITLDHVVAYRDGGGRLSVSRAPEGEGPVVQALTVLHRWWRQASTDPADIAVGRMVRESGLFPAAAAGQLGQLRAGALVYVLDAVRARTLSGDPSIHGAVDAMETALGWDDAEAPLVPGRTDAVQVMNLHRAKGLEAPVVFLAAPFGDRARPPEMRVARNAEGDVRGSLAVIRSAGWSTEVVAQPLSWPEDLDVEAAFQEAERIRLLYVAATRARDELWVARGSGLPKRPGPSPWSPIEEWLDAEGIPQVEWEPQRPPGAARLDDSVDLGPAVARAQEARVSAARPTYALDTVTAVAKGGATRASGDEFSVIEGFAPVSTGRTTRGYEWGSVVHQALAAAGEGLSPEALEQECRSALVEFDRPVDAAGDPVELKELLELIEAVTRSEVWGRAMASDQRFTEVPFAVDLDGDGAAPDVLEGVIDLVFRDTDGWVVADYKTDRGDDPEFESRVHQYRAQVDLYARSWESLVGEPVVQRVLLFTAMGHTERW